MYKSVFGKIRILLIAELLILLTLILLTVYKHDHLFTINLIPTETDSLTLSYQNLDIKPGSYSLTIDYKAENDIYFSISGTDINSESAEDYIHGRFGFLRYHNDSETLRLRTRHRLNSISINLASRDGLEISSVCLTDNCDDYVRSIVTLIAVFILSDCLIWFFLSQNKDRIRKTLPVIITLTAVTTVASLPLFISGIVSGYDYATHLMRIESIYYDLMSGSFPVRINSIFLRNFGYPFSVYYGDILLYPAALLRMAHFDITEVWKIYFFTMNGATAAITYICTKRLFKDSWLSLVLSCAYTAAPFRLASLYARGTIGEFSAMTFLPLIALMIYLIYTQELTKEKSRKYSTGLAFTMSLLICTHLLSTEMVIFTLLIISLILFKKTFSKSVFLTLASSALKTVLLSSFFIIPFIDYYISTPTLISEIIRNEAPAIQEYGITLSDFFSLPLSQRASYSSPGIILTVTLIIGSILLFTRNTNISKDNLIFLRIIIPISILFSIMSTRYFPWNFLGLHSRLGKLIGQIQFPFRFISILSILLMLALGLILKNLQTKQIRLIGYIIFSVSAITSILILSVSYREVKTTAPRNTCELDSETIGSGEYVLSGSNVWYREINDTLLSDANSGIVTDYTPYGTGIILQCSIPDTPHDILIPKYNYKGYRIYDKDGNRLSFMDGANKLISCTLPAGYKGPIYVRFTEPRYWRLAELISLMTVIYLILPLIKKRQNQ